MKKENMRNDLGSKLVGIWENSLEKKIDDN